MIDTGGIEPDTKDIILSQMRVQAEIAMDTADVILFMCDGKEGVTISDREVASMLMKTGKKVVLAVNKIDKPTANVERVKQELTEYELVAEDWGGSTIFVPVSAKTGEGIEDLQKFDADAFVNALFEVPADSE